MFFITYNNRFEIKIKSNDHDEFSDYIDFLKSIYISWDKINKVWFYKVDRFQEMQLWYEKKSIEVLYCDKCYEVYKEHLKTFQSKIQFRRKVELDYLILNPFDSNGKELKLFEFQKQGIDFCLSRNRSFLSDSAGIGKTIQSIFTFTQLYKEGKVNGIFIVVKTGLSYQWKKSILEFVNVFKEDDIVIIDNENKIKLFEVYKDKKIIIVPCHLIAHIFLSYKKDHRLKDSAKNIRWTSYVDINKVWNDKLMLVVDEAHTFNNSAGVWTRALLYHTKFFEYVNCLSATASGNYFERYYNAMQIVDPKAIPFSENAFKLYISEEIGDRYNPYNIQTYNIENIEKIKQQYLSIYFIKRLKSELPEMKHKQIIKPIYVEMSSKHKDLYQKFIQNEVSILEDINKEKITGKLVLNKLPYLIQMLDNPLLLKGRVENEEIELLLNRWKEEYDNKFQLLKNLLEDYVEEQNEKVLIFDNHPVVLDWLSEKFKKYNPLVMHGQMGLDEKRKQEQQDLFNDVNNKHRVLFGNPQVMGVGTNFNKGGRRCILFTSPNDAVLYEQLLDRMYRINNQWDAIVEILLYDNSLDILRYKRNINRVELNNTFLNKNLEREELKRLLEGSL
jgi:hypothetical protein